MGSIQSYDKILQRTLRTLRQRHVNACKIGYVILSIFIIFFPTDRQYAAKAATKAAGVCSGKVSSLFSFRANHVFFLLRFIKNLIPG